MHYETIRKLYAAKFDALNALEIDIEKEKAEVSSFMREMKKQVIAHS